MGCVRLARTIVVKCRATTFFLWGIASKLGSCQRQKAIDLEMKNMWRLKQLSAQEYFQSMFKIHAKHHTGLKMVLRLPENTSYYPCFCGSSLVPHWFMPFHQTVICVITKCPFLISGKEVRLTNQRAHNFTVACNWIKLAISCGIASHVKTVYKYVISNWPGLMGRRHRNKKMYGYSSA